MSLQKCLAIWCVVSTFPTSVLWGQNLSGTKPLTESSDRSAEMRAGFRRFLQQRLRESVAKRPRPDLSDAAAWRAWTLNQRTQLRRLIGAVDKRVEPVRMELCGTVEQPALLAESRGLQIYRVRWPVLPGVFGEGLLLEPASSPRLNVIALPDADDSPEAISGLQANFAQIPFALRLAESGCRVLAMSLIDRGDRWSGDSEVVMTNVPHREWVYRQHGVGTYAFLHRHLEWPAPADSGVANE